jgi:hypothetical protein
MEYFENTLKLRLSHTEKYKAHQQIDTLIQERLAIKFPYSWRALPYPGAEHYSAVQIRSGVKLGLPGERTKSISINTGDILQFSCNFCSLVRPYVGEGDERRRVERHGSTEEVASKLINAGARAGIAILSTDLIGEQSFRIAKPKNPTFVLGHKEFSVISRVTDVALAEQAIVDGLGKKRIFGFGFVSGLEVI